MADETSPLSSARTGTLPQSERIVLYSYALSPFAAKVHCFLGFKGLSFETFYVNPLRVRAELPLGHQVPVLRIDDELRNDSTPIGLWLEERFPQRPALLPADLDARRRVREIDDWVSETLIPVVFRIMLAAGEPLRARIRNRQRGARVLHATVPAGVPLPLRVFYPLLITRPRFIQRLLAAAEPSRPLAALLAAIREDLRRHLGDGPFLAGQPNPTLADLSAYAQLALPDLAGYDRADHFVQDAKILGWFERVGLRLAGAPSLLPAALVERPWCSRPSPAGDSVARAR